MKSRQKDRDKERTPGTTLIVVGRAEAGVQKSGWHQTRHETRHETHREARRAEGERAIVEIVPVERLLGLVTSVGQGLWKDVRQDIESHSGEKWNACDSRVVDNRVRKEEPCGGSGNAARATFTGMHRLDRWPHSYRE